MFEEQLRNQAAGAERTVSKEEGKEIRALVGPDITASCRKVGVGAFTWSVMAATEGLQHRSVMICLICSKITVLPGGGYIV